MGSLAKCGHPRFGNKSARKEGTKLVQGPAYENNNSPLGVKHDTTQVVEGTVGYSTLWKSLPLPTSLPKNNFVIYLKYLCLRRFCHPSDQNLLRSRATPCTVVRIWFTAGSTANFINLQSYGI